MKNRSEYPVHHVLHFGAMGVVLCEDVCFPLLKWLFHIQLQVNPMRDNRKSKGSKEIEKRGCDGAFPFHNLR